MDNNTRLSQISNISIDGWWTVQIIVLKEFFVKLQSVWAICNEVDESKPTTQQQHRDTDTHGKKWEMNKLKFDRRKTKLTWSWFI